MFDVMKGPYDPKEIKIPLFTNSGKFLFSLLQLLHCRHPSVRKFLLFFRERCSTAGMYEWQDPALDLLSKFSFKGSPLKYTRNTAWKHSKSEFLHEDKRRSQRCSFLNQTEVISELALQAVVICPLLILFM